MGLGAGVRIREKRGRRGTLEGESIKQMVGEGAVTAFFIRVHDP